MVELKINWLSYTLDVTCQPLGWAIVHVATYEIRIASYNKQARESTKTWKVDPLKNVIFKLLSFKRGPYDNDF